ncbi:bifunctional folylpolyglutamate synthase/dihydrofolate synthase [Maribacter hydrothermalis]|uniref:Dihydrofolate synthase/folylpolyglutamate synthase n=1 Tax=Maribacter hydrothermalis TaxID=1836467 RepID=A0A1B7ZDP3_9FLAO|nr:folylpolyglutamate synthase/dihydrofolate synthase family protein [Maribacter hydrothermalis]APQ16673.1 tetrahydrofolate synthase [Maribacter hydrothermalis]OBR41423.1 tetrahydrofolate synthase [Maribacter hydrothermalis]
MTYKETLDWMFMQLPMYQHKGKVAFNAKMDGINSLVIHLNNPHKEFKSIHVAGTNGKGSSSHMLASVLQEAGFKVGLYTSPHLKDFRERIRINGKKVEKKYVVDFVKENQDFFEMKKLSFFEMTVGLAFDYFAFKNVDIAIIEVGLGGRLDSTNIITPEVSLITNIGFDHTDMLGDTLKKIAYEKAGIVKPNVPVVISEFNSETASVFREKAAAMNAKIVFAEEKEFPIYKIGLLGVYQKKNIKGVLATLKELVGFKIGEQHIVKGLENVIQNTGLMGRWQQIGKSPKIICDTAHNKEGLEIVLNQLLEEEYNHLHMVIGFVKDKDISAILPLFPKNATYYFCKPKIFRGLDENVLLKQCLPFKLEGNSYKSVNKAFKSAKKQASKDDFIYVGGSNFVVAEVL